jgi:hypothetical protein
MVGEAYRAEASREEVERDVVPIAARGNMAYAVEVDSSSVRRPMVVEPLRSLSYEPCIRR